MTAPARPAELERLRHVEFEARALVARVAEHRRRGWDRIAIGVFDRLAAALDDSEPRQLHDHDRCQLWLTEDPQAVCTCRAARDGDTTGGAA